MAKSRRGDTAGGTPGMPPAFSARFLVRRLVQVVLVLGIVAASVLTLPGFEELRERFSGGRPAWLLAAFALELGSVLSFVVAFRAVFCPRLPWRLSYEVATSEQAANVLLPTGGAGGLALGAWALQRGGMDTRHIARRSVALFLITSAVSFFVIIVAGLAVGLGLAGSARPLLGLVPASLAIVATACVIALPRLLPRAAQSGGSRWRGIAGSAGAALAAGIRDTSSLLRPRRPLVIAGAVGYMAFDVATLGAAFQAFGGVPPAAELALAYGVGQLGGLIPVPGGLGGTDGALIAAFVLYGTPVPAAATAVLAYRAFQLGLPAVIGTAGFVGLQRTLARSPDPAALCAAMAAAAG